MQFRCIAGIYHRTSTPFAPSELSLYICHIAETGHSTYNHMGYFSDTAVYNNQLQAAVWEPFFLSRLELQMLHFHNKLSEI